MPVLRVGLTRGEIPMTQDVLVSLDTADVVSDVTGMDLPDGGVPNGVRD